MRRLVGWRGVEKGKGMREITHSVLLFMLGLHKSLCRCHFTATTLYITGAVRPRLGYLFKERAAI